MDRESLQRRAARGRDRAAAPSRAPSIGKQTLTGSLPASSAPIVQRQEADAPAVQDDDGPLPAPQLAPELARLLDQIAPVPETPTHESITGTNAADNSDGRLTTRTLRWHRSNPGATFTAASRAAGREAGGNGQVPQASPETPRSDTFAPRWAVLLLCSNYPATRSDLPEIALLANAHCPLQSALRGEYSERRTVTNPTGEAMRQAVYRAITDMIPHLVSGQVAELLVNFQGHGGGGGMSGVDWNSVTVAEQSQMAAFARNHNIHLTFVIDTCTAGDAVGEAQGERGHALRRRQGELSAEGQQRLTTAGHLWARLRALNHQLSAVYQLRAAVARESGRERAATPLKIFADVAEELAAYMAGRDAQGPGLGEHRQRLEEARAVALAVLAAPIDRAAIMRLRRAAVPAVSGIGNAVTAMLEQVQAELERGGGGGGGGGGGTGGGAEPTSRE